MRAAILAILFAVSAARLAWAQAEPRQTIHPLSPVSQPRSVDFRGLSSPQRYDWLEFDFDQHHSGNNTSETLISAANVSNLSILFAVALPEIADGAPAVLTGVTTPLGLKDLLFVTTKAGRVVALDATTGEILWSQQSATGPNFTTSSPAVDPNRQFVYSYGLEGAVHKYAVADGTESTGGGWPQTATLKPDIEKESPALSIAHVNDGRTFLYVGNGGYPGPGLGDHQGHVTTIDLATGVQNVFNTDCSNLAIHFVENGTSANDCSQTQSSVWGRPAVIYDEVTDKIFFATANGPFDGAFAGHDWGDSVLALSVDGTGINGGPLDSYTPTDYQTLDSADLDLGSSSPALLPPLATNRFGPLAVQGGKDSVLRLIARADLSLQGGPGHVGGEIQAIPVPQGGQVLPQPAVWTNPADGSAWVFVDTSHGMSGLQIAVDGSGMPSLSVQWIVPRGGSSAILANGVLFYASSKLISALDPASGALLWGDTRIGNIHWESPVLVNGILYITDESGMLTAYSLDGQLPPENAAGDSHKR